MTGNLVRVFSRVLSGFGLLLFASTWKLWTPQSEFPQIPFFGFLIEVPGWVDWLALTLLGLALLTCLWVGARSLVTTSLWLFAIAASVLILLDQHRLQPWAYQFVVFAIILATAKPKTGLFWMRWIVISIYVYSAISKFDYQFIHTVGDQLLFSLAGKFGLDSNAFPGQVRNWIVVTFPTIELLIGLGLMIPRTRRFALFGAVIMHVALLVTLLGNVDGLGVLIWNLFFIVQAVFLFGCPVDAETGHKTDGSQTADRKKRPAIESVAVVASMFVILFPMTQPLGICDHWPAWQVYAPRSSRARLVTYENLAGRFPWDNIPSWSTRNLQVPVYPQARFQLAVAIATQERFPEARGCPIEVGYVSDRWTGVRKTTTLTGPDQFAMSVRQYWLNTKSRSIWLDSQNDPW